MFLTLCQQLISLSGVPGRCHIDAHIPYAVPMRIMSFIWTSYLLMYENCRSESGMFQTLCCFPSNVFSHWFGCFLIAMLLQCTRWYTEVVSASLLLLSSASSAVSGEPYLCLSSNCFQFYQHLVGRIFTTMYPLFKMLFWGVCVGGWCLF